MQFVTGTMEELAPDSVEQQSTEIVKKTTVANDPTKRFSKGRPINNAQMEERVNAAYTMMLSGGSRRENCQALATRYGVSFRQAENYVHAANELMKNDFAGDRQQLLNQVNNMRMHAVKRALKKGNLQVVAHLLDSLARGAGEGTVEVNAAQVPMLSITIDDKRAGSLKSAEAEAIHMLESAGIDLNSEDD